MEINFYGAVKLTNLVVKTMIDENRKKPTNRSKQYSIVNVGSVQSYLGMPYRSVCEFTSTEL
jgi:short-subunit dehydrogenase